MIFVKCRLRDRQGSYRELLLTQQKQELVLRATIWITAAF